MTRTQNDAAQLRWRGRLPALTAIVLSAFTLRTAVTSLTPLLDRLGHAFAFGPTMTGVFGMVPTAAFAALGVVTPALAHRAGLERTALAAMLLAAAGLLARSLCGDTTGLLLGSVVALSGMGIGNVVLPPVVKRYFPDRIAIVSSAYITCLQLGTILPALFAIPLAEAAGWRVSLGAWSLAPLAATAAWIVLLRIERRRTSLLAKVHDRAVAPGDEAPELPPASAAGTVWRSPVAWGLALMFGTTSAIVYSIFTWLPKLLIEAGGTPALGGAMLALFSSLGLLAALCTPAIAARVANPFPIVAICSLAFLGGFAGLLWAPMTLTSLWVALIGAGPGTFPLTLTLINLRTRTSAGSAALSGFVQGVGYTLSCPGPVLFGLLHESSAGWAPPMALLCGFVLVLLISGHVACRPRMLEDTW